MPPASTNWPGRLHLASLATLLQSLSHLYPLSLALSRNYLRFPYGFISVLNKLKAALLAPGKRHTLANARYALHYLDRPSDKRTLKSADELLGLLRDTFGIRLPEQPQLREAVEHLIHMNPEES